VLKNLSESSDFLFSLPPVLLLVLIPEIVHKVRKPHGTTKLCFVWSIDNLDAFYKMPYFMSNLVFTPWCLVSAINEKRYPHETVRYVEGKPRYSPRSATERNAPCVGFSATPKSKSFPHSPAPIHQGSLGFVIVIILTMALGSTQALTEMSIGGGKGGRCYS
jgi:hypothetical protein